MGAFLLRVYALVISITALASSAYSNGALRSANEAFSKKDFRRAEKLYQNALTAEPKNPNIPIFLGAVYYYLGNYEKAVAQVKSSLPKTNQKALGNYIRGLASFRLNKHKAAITALRKSAKYDDVYGSRAIYALAVVFYGKKKKEESHYWASLYLKKFPKATYTDEAEAILKALRKNDFSKTFFLDRKGMRSARAGGWFNEQLYFGYGSIGYEYAIERQARVSLNTASKNNESLILSAKAGLGFGPYSTPAGQIGLGYHYDQDWYATKEQFRYYIKDPTDLNYFPHQGHLLVRTHRLFVDYRSPRLGRFNLGIYFSNIFRRGGSSFNRIRALKRVFSLEKSTRIIPWLGLQWGKGHFSKFYLLLENTISEEDPDRSRQSHSLFGGNGTYVSIGLKHSADFSAYQSKLDGAFYRYKLVYEDPWQDRVRLGFYGSYEWYGLPPVSLILHYHSIKDSYRLDVIRSRQCGLLVSGSEGTDQDEKPKQFLCSHRFLSRRR